MAYNPTESQRAALLRGMESGKKEREISIRLFLEAIGENGATKREVMARAGISNITFIRVYKQLREEGRARICGYILRRDEMTGERKAGTQIFVYGPGGEPDAQRPRPLPKAKAMAKYAIKHRAVLRAKRLARDGRANMFDQLRLAA